ncbi:MAG TPA: DUF1461 domain-containing protein [Firmicutes bacterium]|nr:DUF1461 domain-containing protein [Bacillota bacterium]
MNELTENRWKILRLLIDILAGLALFAAAVLIAVRWVSFDSSFYAAEFIKFDRSAYTGISQEELTKVVNALLEYLSGKAASPQITVIIHGTPASMYKERELLHLADVAHLYALSKSVIGAGALAFGCCLLLRTFLSPRRSQKLASLLVGIKNAGIVAMLVLASFAMASRADFNRLFTLFHLTVFSNDLWLLNESEHNLIKMFPEAFFYDAAARAGKACAAAFALLILVPSLPAWRNE